jgi:hypothetical protein
MYTLRANRTLRPTRTLTAAESTQWPAIDVPSPISRRPAGPWVSSQQLGPRYTRLPTAIRSAPTSWIGSDSRLRGPKRSNDERAASENARSRVSRNRL